MAKFLVATDGSKTSEHAAKVAIDLAEEGNKIYCVHVMDPRRYSLHPGGPPMSQLRDQYNKNAKEYIETIAEMAGETGLEHEEILLEGKVVQKLTSFAEEEGIDKIVVGTVGKDSLGDVLFGSTSQRLVANSNIPVLVVPSPIKGKIKEK